MVDFLKNLPVPKRSETKQKQQSSSRNEFLVSSDPSLASYILLPAPAFKDHSSLLVSNPHSLQPLPQQQKRHTSAAPPYGCRHRWLPRCQDDFEDGGAFPEIAAAQFPLGMGSGGSAADQVVVSLQTGPDGKLCYDAVIRQGLSHRSAIYTRPADAKAKWSAASDLRKPSEETEEETQQKTKTALEAAVAKKMASSTGLSSVNTNKAPEFIKYTPSNQTPGHNANCSQRIIRMVDAQIDPIEPPKHRHKRVPAGPPSPPPAILHSPPRKLTAADQEEWKIPPCVSNWKNQKGFTIPLDKRLLADGRGLQDLSINDKFASLSEALYIAERSAREQIRMRNELLKQKKQQEENLREQQLRELAARARAERAALINRESAATAIGAVGAAAGTETRGTTEDNDESRHEDEATEREADSTATTMMIQTRSEIERQRRRKVERELRLERAGKKRSRDDDRDISERVALGQAKPTSQEALYDSRLFNQSAGMDSGFGEGDRYNIYDKPLFTDRSSQSIYRVDLERMQENTGYTERLPVFAGAAVSAAEASRQRTAPVAFEKDSDDPFGLESLMEASKKKQKAGG